MNQKNGEWIVLGRSGPYPVPMGACSGYLFKAADTALLFDLGAGTFSRLIAHVDPKNLAGVFISHWHGDHTSDLLVFEYYLQNASMGGEKQVLPLYGPADENSPLYRYISASPYFTFTPLSQGDEVLAGGLKVKAGPARHTVPGVGYRVKDWVYTGDTNNTPGLEAFIAGAQVLVACGCMLEADWNENSPHLSGAQAGALAKRAGVGRLYLTHLKPTVDIQKLENEAKAVFPNTFIIEEKRYTL